MSIRTDPVVAAVAAIAAGQAVVVVDDEHRENEGDLIVAADAATPAVLGFMVRHTSGVICVGMTGADLDRLELPPMVAHNTDPKQTAYTVSVDLRTGSTTGISATERAATVRALVDPGTRPGDLTRPGHVFPLRAVPGGVRVRPGHTEAAVDLARAAGRPPAGALAEIVDDDGEPLRGDDLRAFADRHGLVLVSVADLAAALADGAPAVAAASPADPADTVDPVDPVDPVPASEPPPPGVVRVAESTLPTRTGAWRVVAFREPRTAVEHVALVMGDPTGEVPVLVRVHSECLTGDALGSWRCDCGAQLAAAQEMIAAAGRGILVYLRGHEGRGIGLAHKIAAYALQDGGLDTVDANLELGLPADARDYAAAAGILRDLGVRSVELVTHNGDKVDALQRAGLPVTRVVQSAVGSRPENLPYLRTKRDRMGHRLDGLDDQLRAQPREQSNEQGSVR